MRSVSDLRRHFCPSAGRSPLSVPSLATAVVHPRHHPLRRCVISLAPIYPSARVPRGPRAAATGAHRAAQHPRVARSHRQCPALSACTVAIAGVHPRSHARFAWGTLGDQARTIRTCETSAPQTDSLHHRRSRCPPKKPRARSARSTACACLCSCTAPRA
eukprot:4419523-Alexandrium_andersonii.AAC.1